MIFTVPLYAQTTIICNTSNPEGSLHVNALKKFGELVSKYSKGELVAEIHYLGNKKYPAIKTEEINVNMLVFDNQSIHISVIATGNIALRAPVLNFLMFPFLFPTVKSAEKLFSSNFIKKDLNDLLAKTHNVRALSWLIGGFRQITNSKRPITQLSDLKDLRIRTPRNRIMRDTYNALGAKSVPLNWNETFDALFKGEVDGQENPYNVIYYSKFWNAHQKYLTVNGPFLWTGPILINENYFNQLPRHQKDILLRAAQEAAQYQWSSLVKKNEFYKDEISKKGIMISEIKDKNKWVLKTRSIWYSYYKRIGYGNITKGGEFVEKVERILQKR